MPIKHIDFFSERDTGASKNPNPKRFRTNDNLHRNTKHLSLSTDECNYTGIVSLNGDVAPSDDGTHASRKLKKGQKRRASSSGVGTVANYLEVGAWNDMPSPTHEQLEYAAFSLGLTCTTKFAAAPEDQCFSAALGTWLPAMEMISESMAHEIPPAQASTRLAESGVVVGEAAHFGAVSMDCASGVSMEVKGGQQTPTQLSRRSEDSGETRHD